jgi:NAD(P)-dependent dehydrogenase (short-subunit alcohol dehydrogenase family)
MSVRGKVAVITGGASGIGLATAEMLAHEGASLVLADIEPDALAAAAARLGQTTDVIGVETDVSDRASMQDLAARAHDRFEHVDIAFFNAGVGTTGPIVEASHDDWEWMIGVNLWGAIHGVEAFLPAMTADPAGRHVIFTASFAGLVGNAGLGPYSVAKYGVVALAETLHRETRATGLAVSVLCPMVVQTNIETSHRNRPSSLGGPRAGRDVDFSDPQLARTMISPEDAAAVVMEGIRTKRLYLFTHPECRPMIARRFAQIDAAFDEHHIGT